MQTLQEELSLLLVAEKYTPNKFAFKIEAFPVYLGLEHSALLKMRLKIIKRIKTLKTSQNVETQVWFLRNTAIGTERPIKFFVDIPTSWINF